MLLPSAVKSILKLQDTRNTFVSLWGFVLFRFVFDTQFGSSFACIAKGRIFEIPSNNHTRFSVLLLVMGKWSIFKTDHSCLLED